MYTVQIGGKTGPPAHRSPFVSSAVACRIINKAEHTPTTDKKQHILYGNTRIKRTRTIYTGRVCVRNPFNRVRMRLRGDTYNMTKYHCTGCPPPTTSAHVQKYTHTHSHLARKHPHNESASAHKTLTYENRMRVDLFGEMSGRITRHAHAVFLCCFTRAGCVAPPAASRC